MSAYTPLRRASRAWVRTFRASAMFTPSRRAASTSAAARSRIVSARAYLRCPSACSIAFDVSGRIRLYSRSARAFRASARWLSASSTFPPRSRAYRTRDSAFSRIPWRTRSRRWSSVRMDTRRRRRSAAGLVDVTLECEGLDARLRRPLEDGVSVGQGIRDARLAACQGQNSPGGPREIEGPSEVPGGLRLLGSLEEAPRERRVGRIVVRGPEVLPRRREGPFRDVGGRPRG